MPLCDSSSDDDDDEDVDKLIPGKERNVRVGTTAMEAADFRDRTENSGGKATSGCSFDDSDSEIEIEEIRPCPSPK